MTKQNSSSPIFQLPCNYKLASPDEEWKLAINLAHKSLTSVLTTVTRAVMACNSTWHANEQRSSMYLISVFAHKVCSSEDAHMITSSRLFFMFHRTILLRNYLGKT